MADQLKRYQQARLARDPRFDGVFFVAVKSTGIFCRPICPAPLPKEVNVEYFDMAQQAMLAGFRPCLRCRPDSAPFSFAWKGTDTTVERAIKLIRQHPDQPLTTLAERLGITDRYLRQLFQQRLGVSPKQFQLYEKLLFAKQLLHQSGMPIEHVAQASGFSSARRLQEHMKNSLNLNPRQIRATKHADLHALHLSLSFRPPYNWQQVREFLSRRAVPEMEWCSENSYGRTYQMGSAKGRFVARYNETQQCFDVSLTINQPEQLKAVVMEIRRVLDLDAHPQTIETALSATGLPDDLLCRGIRLPGVWSLFEAGCRAILGQQISVTAAVNLVSRLVTELGEKEEEQRFFPAPAAVAASNLDFLGMPDSRRQTLRRFAEFCSEHDNWRDTEHWLDIKGIGPWTVAYANMRGLSDPDIWMHSDLVIKKQIQQHTLSADAAQPWRSYLTFQLWSIAS